MTSYFKSSNCRYKRSRPMLLLILVSLAAMQAHACDICGCFMGITPYDNQSSLSILYRYRSFSGYNGQQHPFFPRGTGFFPPGSSLNAPVTDHLGNPSDFEVYRATELRARYFLSRRMEINAILPYIANTEQYNGNLSTLTGLGDVNIYAGYHLLRSLDQQTINQRLIIGAGIKLPTGKDNQENVQGDRYNMLSQTGTGSTDGFMYLTYIMGYKKAGMSLSGTYKVNGRNREDQGIANSATSYLNVFYNLAMGTQIKLVPSAQLAYEYSGGEKEDGVKTGEHVMNNLMSGIGADLFIKNITLNMAVQTRAWTASDDHPQPSGRVILGITYNFKQLYYLR